MVRNWWYIWLLILQVIEKSVEVGADSDQFPSNWIFHYREKKPGKVLVDGLVPDLSLSRSLSQIYPRDVLFKHNSFNLPFKNILYITYIFM